MLGHRIGASALAWVVLSCAFAGSAFAQERPSLEGAETEIARTQAALCAMADVEGKTYRPFFCPPRCDCLSPVTIHAFNDYQAVSCNESPAYEFTVTGASDWGSCTVPGCSVGGTCAESSRQNCTQGQTCPAGETCVLVGIGDFDCVKPCSVDAQCTSSEPRYCDATSGTACSVSTDCALGESCTQGSCRRGCGGAGTPCTDAGSVTLYNVRDADSPEVASCGGQIVNSADALACLAQIESLYGIACAGICGNGVLQAGEQCDDGNTTPGDGCAADCTTE